MAPSKYDELHDRFLTLLSTKDGTRYERLAALVFKSLHDRHVVIHDFKLLGNSAVKHQIDILIEENGKSKRILIECKDFDKSNKLVGLGIIRDFRSVIEDTNANEAFVITCTGYTKPAKKYAKAKGIKLAVLRAFEDSDWEGRIRRVIVQLHIQSPPRIEGVDLMLDQPEHAVLVADMQAEGIGQWVGGQQRMGIRTDNPFFLVSEKEKIQFQGFVDREAEKESVRTQQQSVILTLNPNDWKIQIGERNLIRFTKLVIRARTFEPIIQNLEIASDRIAELILNGFGDHEVIVFADELQAMTIDPDGKVVARQK